MKRIYITLITSLILVGCKSHVDQAFDYIDFSYYSGWNDYYAIKILPSGQSYIFNDNFKKGKFYLTYQLEKNSFDSIAKLTKLIHQLDVDTSYTIDCQDCETYNLIIKYKEKKFRLYVVGLYNSNDRIKIVNNLVYYVLQLTSQYRDSLNTEFKFESRTNQFYPPPAPSILISP